MMDSTDMTIQDLQYGLWGWYDFSDVDKMLWVDGTEELSSHFHNLPKRVDCISLDETTNEDWLQKHIAEYDVILSIAGIEKLEAPVAVLAQWKKLLKPSGKLLLGMNNRFGLKYFCGDRDPYTMCNFDGIENYRSINRSREENAGRMYSKAEIKEMLTEAGLKDSRFYSVLPDLANCTLIYAEDSLPDEDLANRLFPVYNYPESVFLEEQELYAGLVKNDMFHQMANAYLVECSLSGDLSNVFQVTSSMERGKENAFFTLIRRDGMVEKRPAYYEGKIQLQNMALNHARLKERGVCAVDGYMENASYIMPYVTGVNGLNYLEVLMETDKEKFLKELDRFCDLVRESSEIYHENLADEDSAFFHHGFIDMVPWNTIYRDGEFVFFDQEFCVENYPVKAILIRTIGYLQGVANSMKEKVFSEDFLFQRYNLAQNKDIWLSMEREFFEQIKQEKELREYHNGCKANYYQIQLNRQKINYSSEKYQRLFINIFHNADHRKLILFGSGRFAEKFMTMYKVDYPVYKIIDNNSARWGQSLDGVEIVSPDILREMGQGEYKVIVCIKNYTFVTKQLDDMGVTEYSIYDANRIYPRKKKTIVQTATNTEEEPKKYHIGYVAGVFDLFHYGHLNILRRAKEQCDYLIVGVVSDRQVREGKKVEPFVPFDERLEIVRSCRYVDEAHEIPFEHPDTDTAWQLYQFDVQFSGSDYEHDPAWLAKKKWLEERGSTMVFYPYTQSTSSTKLKKLITERLI